MMLNGGLWRVCFGDVRKLLILERETGIEPATNSLEVWRTFDLLGLRRFILVFLGSLSSIEFTIFSVSPSVRVVLS